MMKVSLMMLVVLTVVVGSLARTLMDHSVGAPGKFSAGLSPEQWEKLIAAFHVLIGDFKIADKAHRNQIEEFKDRFRSGDYSQSNFAATIHPMQAALGNGDYSSGAHVIGALVNGDHNSGAYANGDHISGAHANGVYANVDQQKSE